MQVWSWGLHKQFHTIDQVIEPPRMLCWAAKWVGSKQVLYRAEWDGVTDGYADSHHGSANRLSMLNDLRLLMDKADMLVHYNGHTFDVPWIKGELARCEFDPPSPSLEVDLYRQSRQQFRFPSHKLQYVSTALGLPGKAETGGFSLWKDALAGDPKAHAKFKKYNVQDVRLTEQLYFKMLPWLKLPTNLDGSEVCPRVGCPGGALEKRGMRRTGAGLYQRYQCHGCGGWVQGKSIVQSLPLRNYS